MLLPQSLTRRHGVLVLASVSVVYIISSFAYYGSPVPSLILTDTPPIPQEQPLVTISSSTDTASPPLASPTAHLELGVSQSIPETSVTAHAPGWTLFQNLYMSNGTFYIVTSNRETVPEIRMITSTGLIALNTPENIAAREPTDQEMKVIDPKDAMSKWGRNIADNQRHRISTVEGNTLFVNEPWQFLNHYYHFVAELLLGTWAFIYGAFNPSTSFVGSSENFGHTDPMIPSFNLQSQSLSPPRFSRVIFLHASSDEWRDKPGFNAFFLRAAFPSIDVETSEDWNDRVASTAYKPVDNGKVPAERAWHFPVAVLSDRSAAFRGDACGSRTQRIAAESWELMVQKGGIDPFGGWWSGVRESVLRFAGILTPKSPDIGNPSLYRKPGAIGDAQSLLPLPTQCIITYINRQGVRRHLIPEHHDGLVFALEQMVKRKQVEGKGWVLKVVQPELLTKEDQLQLASESTIMLGVHGNGLTHLVLMNPNRYSSVVEIFYPGGFAHDYEWTTRALGMRHFSVWNDTYFTYPNEPPSPSYPEGFQGTAIPVHGPTIAKLIEDRLEGRLEF